MSRRIRKAAAALASALASFAPIGAGPAQAAPPSDCAYMTGSITRLYNAYFGRGPDLDGLAYWTSQYQHGTGLETISQALADSPGSRVPDDPGQFVDWLYLTTNPDTIPVRATEWVGRISAGYPRALAVLTFTESEAYVIRTHTRRPLAGYLRWYPAGTRWSCGQGGGVTSTGSITNDTTIDTFVDNHGTAVDQVTIASEQSGKRRVTIASEALNPAHHDYQWNGSFNGSGYYGNQIRVTAGPATSWIVVAAPSGIGEERLGW